MKSFTMEQAEQAAVVLTPTTVRARAARRESKLRANRAVQAAPVAVAVPQVEVVAGDVVAGDAVAMDVVAVVVVGGPQEILLSLRMAMQRTPAMRAAAPTTKTTNL